MSDLHRPFARPGTAREAASAPAPGGRVQAVDVGPQDPAQFA
jgi:hypothetical protein